MHRYQSVHRLRWRTDDRDRQTTFQRPETPGKRRPTHLNGAFTGFGNGDERQYGGVDVVGIATKR